MEKSSFYLPLSLNNLHLMKKNLKYKSENGIEI